MFSSLLTATPFFRSLPPRTLSTLISPHLNTFPVLVQIPVQWGDMDAFQHVNNVQYIKFFESARINHFYRIGSKSVKQGRALDFQGFMNATGVGPILASTSCKYKYPAKYPDTLTACSRIPVDSIGDDKFTMEYRVVSEESGRIVADGEGVIVMYDYKENKRATISDALRKAIEGVEEEEPSFGIGDGLQ